MNPGPRIAFVTDALPLVGGAEKSVFAALEAFPQADLFALIYNRQAFAGTPIARRRVRASPLDRLPFVSTYYRALLPFMPRAVERFDLGGYDRVVSFSYAVAHGVRVRPGTRHVSYTYTPMRYAWRDLPTGPLFDRYLRTFRRWDRAAAARLDAIASISQAVQARVEQAYRRESRVIYPPVELDRFRPAGGRGNYYVTLARLVAHKRIDLVVDAFSRLGLPLVVIGAGPELRKLRLRAGSNVRFVGHQPDSAAAGYLGEARAFVSAAEEDFGIAMVEAQAAGCPVIAYGRGGALETVREMETGLFFHEQSVEGLTEAVRRFEAAAGSFRTSDAVQNAARFSKGRFQREFAEFVLGG
jgi:glycosyltransferase involved in cell wall biosynthesis